MCPADIVILDAGDIKNKQSICYIDSNLIDGQTNLVEKKASFLTQGY